ncbi:MAG TPA: biotin--[acetyl-CoA-carboxylase] ligase [Actinomycetaceae bacterium]|nr:biotin--[acetyl-CoA-carboxylase] ligase [Actinomycetaceae bacterium]
MSFTRIVRVERTGSTNTDLIRALDTEPAEWPHLSALVADDQTGGRGRAGRGWESLPGASLNCSVVIILGDDALPVTWVPLLVGVAVRRALRLWLDTDLKWPNDVLVAGGEPVDVPAWGWARKLGGILCERHVSGAVVAGIGINCRHREDELPVAWAASIATATGTSGPRPAHVLRPLGETLRAVLDDWKRDAAAVLEEYVSASVIVGRQVRVTGASVEKRGTVAGFGEDGALILETDEGEIVSVSAGDVERLR